MKKHNLAFIDLETTGLNLKKHEIIEIGCIITTPTFQIIEEFELKIKPQALKNADPVSLKISHFREENWQNAYPEKEAIKIFSEKVKNCIMVGHNVAFDAGFLEYAFTKNGMQNNMHYHKLDTISIAWAKLHHEPDLKHFSLRELCLRFGIKNEHSHTALSDARATFLLYKKLMSL